MVTRLSATGLGEIHLDEFVEEFHRLNIDPLEQEDLQRAAPLLRMLANNTCFFRTFLEGFVRNINAKRDPCLIITRNCQEFGIRKLSGGHMLRAIIWPSENDELFYKADTPDLFYAVPHNHSFHFITTGYSGPGYISDFYNVEGSTAGWYPGLHVNVPYAGRHQLDTQSVIFYRQEFDVHAQFAPESLSVSLSVVAPGDYKLPQFTFDRAVKKVEAIYQYGNRTSLLGLAVATGEPNLIARVESIYNEHNDDIVSFQALRALSMNKRDEDLARRVIELGLIASSARVRGMSNLLLEKYTKEAVP